MKTWFDRKARTRTFRPGDQVLVLFPIHGSPLQAWYCGPYTVEKRTSEVDYVISTPDRRKLKRLCHINMLKPYHGKDGPTSCRTVTNIATVSSHPPNNGIDPSPVEKGMKLHNSDILDKISDKLNHLPENKSAVIKQLVEEFSDLFPDVPGRTTAT